jgi:hypothetical protein
LRIAPVRENDKATYYCTAFPVSTMLASAWDPDLAYRVGQAMGNEVLEYGVDVLLGPAMNIHRNPLCGRNFEYYSEDPLVAGKVAASVVNGVESQGVGTSVKHFAANNTETNRNALDTIVSERALREIYLDGYRIVVEEAQPWTIVDGLKGAGYTLDTALLKSYGDYLRVAEEKRPKARAFMPLVPIPERPLTPALAASMAAGSDIALITIGRNSGEFFDRKVEGDFNLTAGEIDLIKTVCGAFHSRGKKAIVVLNIGGVIETASWKQFPDAILLAWQAGQESGNSVADVISGKVNPSGKLASTFPVRYEDVPSAKNFPGKVVDAGAPGQDTSSEQDGMKLFDNTKASRIVYEEGIYVGYRYYESFGIKPSYEFGYGLSYTSFEYGSLTLSSGRFSGEITATLDVKNSGKTAGREAVQLYIAAPAKKLDKPALELKAFAKTKLLSPGESQTLSFVLKPRQLASFDSASSSWVAEAGEYQVKAGGLVQGYRSERILYASGRPDGEKRECRSHRQSRDQ